MSAYRTPGHVEPTLTPEEERKFYEAVPLFSAPVNVPAWMTAAVGLTILIVFAAFIKSAYYP